MKHTINGNEVSLEATWEKPRHGIYRAYFDNGQLSYEAPYIDGRKYGLCRGWSENGDLVFVRIYVNGRPQPLPMPRLTQVVLFGKVVWEGDEILVEAFCRKENDAS